MFKYTETVNSLLVIFFYFSDKQKYFVAFEKGFKGF